MRHAKAFSAKTANALTKQLIKIKPRERRGGKVPPDSALPRLTLPRVDVVSESLCDDVIKYLSPTLDKHKGCTLIDLQPGACLFSSKLHDYLKPKCHLLIEPEDYYYEPFIKPLLTQPGSTYRYTPLDLNHHASYWHEFQKIKDDPNLLPAQKQLDSSDLTRRRLDHSTLIIGNLAREPWSKSKLHKHDNAAVFLYNMAYSVLGNRSLHSNGLVRMLFWIPEHYKSQIFSVIPWSRSSLQASLGLNFHTSEAASVQPLVSLFKGRSKFYHRRVSSALLNSVTNRQVASSMRNLGLTPPPGRTLSISEASLPPEANDITPLSPLRINVTGAAELRKKAKRLSERITTAAAWVRSKRNKFPRLACTLEYPQVSVVVDEYGKHSSYHDLEWTRTKVVLDLGLRVLNVEANFKHLEETLLDQEKINDLHATVWAVSEQFATLLESSANRIREAFSALFEDQVAFFVSPRLVNFAQRKYEPLKAASSDFYPQQDLALFDFTPKPKSISVPGLATSEECARFCSQLIIVLFSSRGHSLPHALDAIGVNAAKDLVPMVPAITDPRRGGRLNPKHMRVRMVTDEMIEGLVKAFFEWPFRPQSWEVALLNHSGFAGVEGEEDEDDAGKEEQTKEMTE